MILPADVTAFIRTQPGNGMVNLPEISQERITWDLTMKGSITHMLPSGEITRNGNYDSAVKRLCQLEDRWQPGERYTIRLKNGEAFPRRGIELVMSRLYYYEHLMSDEMCR